MSHSSNLGGTEVCFGRALRHLVSSGCEVFGAYPDGLFAEEWQGIAPRLPFSGSLPSSWRVKGYAGWLIRSIRARAGLAKWIRQHRPDAVVVFSSVITSAVSAASSANVPCIVYIREFISPSFVQTALLRFLGAKASSLITVSQALAEMVAKHTVADVAVVHDGVELAPDTRQADRSGIRVVCYAGYNPMKGGEVFVRAAAMVALGISDVQFVLYGVALPSQRSYAGHLRSLVHELGLANQFEFLETRDFQSTFASADLIVVPSLEEGLGLVALEGMAAGVPIVASATGGLLDIVVDGETGCFFRKGSAEDLSRVLMHLLLSENLQAMGTAARQRVKEGFSVEASMRGLDGVLYKLLSEHMQSVDASRSMRPATMNGHGGPEHD